MRTDEPSDKKPVASYERKPDTDLWSKARELSKGNLEDKLECLDILFRRQYELPAESKQLALELVGKGQPKEVKLAAAKHLSDNPHVPTGMFMDVLSALSKDPDKEVSDSAKEVMKKIYGPMMEMTERYYKSIQSAFSAASPTMLAANRLAEQWSKIFAQTSFLTELNRMGEEWRKVTAPLAASVLSAKQITPYLERYSELNKMVTRSLIFQPSFYPEEELAVVEKAGTIPKTSEAEGLLKRLKACPDGSDGWREYETICSDILAYCLVPPLLDPIVQSDTSDGMHRRDIIFHIPHGANGFWNYVMMRFGSMAMIVDCKNYSKSLKENEILITSKYFGKKKLTTFGLVVTRHGAEESAFKTQVAEWRDSDKMIVCLNDVQLERMLQLKEGNDDPSKIIDDALREFLQSISY